MRTLGVAQQVRELDYKRNGPGIETHLKQQIFLFPQIVQTNSGAHRGS
jgi:hypothetical protein